MNLSYAEARNIVFPKLAPRPNGVYMMARVFGETSATDEVLSGVNLKGKRVLVTGVSSGLGVETARSLAAHGAQVVGAARDLKKADAATGSSGEGRRS